MMYRLSSLLFVAAFPIFSAQAQTVEIRSGEHAKFSRLVLYLGEEKNWRFGRTPEGYGLRIDDSLFYDQSQIFEFIPRSRLLNVVSVDTGLDFIIECDCHAEAFEYRPEILVLDFKDGPAQTDSSFEMLLSGPMPDNSRDQAAELIKKEGGQGFYPSDVTEMPEIAPLRSDQAKNPIASGLDSSFLFARAVHDEGAFALAEEVRHGLSRAVAFGMLDPSKQPAIAAATSERSAGGTGVTIRTGLVSDQSALQNSETPSCAPAEYFDVSAWGGGLPASEVIAAARSTFLDDLGRPQDGSALNLARAYLHLGFGAEARETLRTYPIDGPPGDAALAIARQLDMLDMNGSAVLRDQLACRGPGALWALIALGKDPRVAAAPNVDAIYQTLSAMPLHLRSYLAPTVSARLRALGFDEDAAAARQALARAQPKLDAAMALETALATPDRPDSDLEKVANGTSALAVHAQAEMLRRLAASRQPVPTSLREEVETRLHEAKGTEVANELAGAYFTALARSEAHEYAYILNRRLARSGLSNGESLNAQAIEVLASLAAEGSDGALLLVARDVVSESMVSALPPEVANAMAARILDLGFESLAEPFAAVSEETLGLARRHFLARKALEEGRQAEIVALLASNRDSVSMALKAAALMEMTAFSEAAVIFEDLGDTERAAEAFWRAGRWASAAALLPEGERRHLALRLAAAEPESGVPATEKTVPSLSTDGDSEALKPLSEPPVLAVPSGAASVAPVPAEGSPPTAAGRSATTAAQGRPDLSETVSLLDESRSLRLLAEELLSRIGPGT